MTSKNPKNAVKSGTTKMTTSSKSAAATAIKGRKRASTSSIKKENKNQLTSKKSRTAKARIEENNDKSDAGMKDDWEDEVSSVETVTRDEKTGELLIYLKW